MSIISIIAGVLFIIGFIPYIYTILKKETKPVRVSWIIWAILDIITLLGMYYEHAVNGQMLGAVIGSIAVTILSLKYGVPGWTKMDKFCLAGAIIGIALWQTFDNPKLGIIASCIAGFIGSVPTFASAWEDSSRENKFAWGVFWISCIFAVIAIPKRTLADAAAPLTFLAIESIMMFILFVRPYFIVGGIAKRIRR